MTRQTVGTDATIDVARIEEIVGEFAPPCEWRAVLANPVADTFAPISECDHAARWVALKACGCVKLYCDRHRDRILVSPRVACTPHKRVWTPGSIALVSMEAL